MRYLLDTNIVIAYLNNEMLIIEKVESLDDIYISSVILGELYFGANLSSYKDKNFNRINEFLLESYVFDVTSQTAYEYALIKSKLKTMGKPLPDNDIWIAAIAQEHNMTILTRDKHFLTLDFIKTEIW